MRKKGGYISGQRIRTPLLPPSLSRLHPRTPETLHLLPPSSSTYTSPVSQRGTTVVPVCSQRTADLQHPPSLHFSPRIEPNSHVSSGLETPPTCQNLAKNP